MSLTDIVLEREPFDPEADNIEELMLLSIQIGNLELCKRIFATGRCTFELCRIGHICPPYILEWIREVFPHRTMPFDENYIKHKGIGWRNYFDYEPTLVAWMKKRADLTKFVEDMMYVPQETLRKWTPAIREFMPRITTRS